MSDVKFIGGLSFKAKNANAPEYVICKGSIKREDLIAWLQSEQGEWINFDVKESKGGKMYAAVDTWKPNGGGSARHGGQQQRQRSQQQQKSMDHFADALDDFADDDLPFISSRGQW